MTQKEFDRIKEEEKKHLREMRGLKRTYRQAKQKKSLVDSLTKMTDALGNAESREEVDDIMRDAAAQEARLEIALESEEEDREKEKNREEIQRMEASSLLRQMKHELGQDMSSKDANDEAPTPESADSSSTSKTLGRPRNG